MGQREHRQTCMDTAIKLEDRAIASFIAVVHTIQVPSLGSLASGIRRTGLREVLSLHLFWFTHRIMVLQSSKPHFLTHHYSTDAVLSISAGYTKTMCSHNDTRNGEYKSGAPHMHGL